MTDRERPNDKWPPVYQVAFWFLTASVIVFSVIVVFAVDRLNTRINEIDGRSRWLQGQYDKEHEAIWREMERRND